MARSGPETIIKSCCKFCCCCRAACCTCLVSCRCREDDVGEGEDQLLLGGKPGGEAGDVTLLRVGQTGGPVGQVGVIRHAGVGGVLQQGPVEVCRTKSCISPHLGVHHCSHVSLQNAPKFPAVFAVVVTFLYNQPYVTNCSPVQHPPECPYFYSRSPGGPAGGGRPPQ